MRNIMFVLLLFLTANLYAPAPYTMQRVNIAELIRQSEQKLMKERALNEPFSQELFYNVLKMHVEHPEIVMRQAILETGWFTSKSFTEGNNFSGMKLPTTRCTKATGSVHGHASYTHWYDCVIDYRAWQKYWHVEGKTE